MSPTLIYFVSMSSAIVAFLSSFVLFYNFGLVIGKYFKRKSHIYFNTTLNDWYSSLKSKIQFADKEIDYVKKWLTPKLSLRSNKIYIYSIILTFLFYLIGLSPLIFEFLFNIKSYIFFDDQDLPTISQNEAFTPNGLAIAGKFTDLIAFSSIFYITVRLFYIQIKAREKTIIIRRFLFEFLIVCIIGHTLASAVNCYFLNKDYLNYLYPICIYILIYLYYTFYLINKIELKYYFIFLSIGIILIFIVTNSIFDSKDYDSVNSLLNKEGFIRQFGFLIIINFIFDFTTVKLTIYFLNKIKNSILLNKIVVLGLIFLIALFLGMIELLLAIAHRYLNETTRLMTVFSPLLQGISFIDYIEFTLKIYVYGNNYGVILLSLTSFIPILFLFSLIFLRYFSLLIFKNYKKFSIFLFLISEPDKQLSPTSIFICMIGIIISIGVGFGTYFITYSSLLI